MNQDEHLTIARAAYTLTSIVADLSREVSLERCQIYMIERGFFQK